MKAEAATSQDADLAVDAHPPLLPLGPGHVGEARARATLFGIPDHRCGYEREVLARAQLRGAKASRSCCPEISSRSGPLGAVGNCSS
jgi:hypothetical protein